MAKSVAKRTEAKKVATPVKKTVCKKSAEAVKNAAGKKEVKVAKRAPADVEKRHPVLNLSSQSTYSDS